MRVTQQMMIDGMMYQITRQASLLYDTEIKVGANRQINTPSDDVISTRMILADRATISKYSQYQSNILQAENWIEADVNILDTVYDLLQDAIEVATQQSSGELDNQDIALEQFMRFSDEIVDLANSRYGGGYMYSGDQTSTQPFFMETTVDGGAASDIVFDLADAAATVTVEISDSSGNVVRTINVGACAAGANTIAWNGLDDLGATLPDGDYSFSVTAEDASGQAVGSYPTYRGDTGTKQVIVGEGQTVELNRDGESIFSSALRVLSEAIAAMQSVPYDPTALSNLFDDFETAASEVKAEMIDLSTVNLRLENTDDRLALTTLTVETRLSETLVGSTEEAAVKLQAQQTAYETTMSAMAQILDLTPLIKYL